MPKEWAAADYTDVRSALAGEASPSRARAASAAAALVCARVHMAAVLTDRSASDATRALHRRPAWARSDSLLWQGSMRSAWPSSRSTRSSMTMWRHPSLSRRSRQNRRSCSLGSIPRARPPLSSACARPRARAPRHRGRSVTAAEACCTFGALQYTLRDLA